MFENLVKYVTCPKGKLESTFFQALLAINPVLPFDFIVNI